MLISYNTQQSNTGSVTILQTNVLKPTHFPLFLKLFTLPTLTDAYRAKKRYYIIQSVAFPFYSGVSTIILALSVFCAEVNARIWTSYWQ
jgi:hypothetical protein